MTMQATRSNMPVILLREGATETKGREAQKNNIAACKIIAEIVKSSLGPRGMDKMLVDSLGDVTITNDGATILKEIDVQHPAAKMLVEISKTTDNEVGDGTTSVVILAGALLENAESLINQNVHPIIIVDGYRKAAKKAKQYLEEIADVVTANDKSILQKIAKTAMQTKLVRKESSHLAELVVKAVTAVSEQEGEKFVVDIDDIKVEKKAGGSIEDCKIIEGIVLVKEIVHGGMPKQMKAFLDEENRMLKNMVDKVIASGATVVLCQKGIDDMAQHYLAKAGILAVRRVKESDLTKLSKATGARIVSNLDDLFEKDLGTAGLVEERKIEEDRWVFIEECKHPKSVTLLLRAGSQRVVDEVERSVHDAIMVVRDVMELPSIVAGGGAPETYTASKIRSWSKSLEGREQLAAEKFADALETIPLILSENAGMDPIDTLATLRSKQSKGEKWTGIDVMKGHVGNMKSSEIIEPLSVKNQIISAAAEVACMILRIDDVIAPPKYAGPPPGAEGGMPPGMGGMGGMGGMPDMGGMM